MENLVLSLNWEITATMIMSHAGKKSNTNASPTSLEMLLPFPRWRLLFHRISVKLEWSPQSNASHRVHSKWFEQGKDFYFKSQIKALSKNLSKINKIASLKQALNQIIWSNLPLFWASKVFLTFAHQHCYVHNL